MYVDNSKGREVVSLSAFLGTSGTLPYKLHKQELSPLVLNLIDIT